MTRRIEGFRVRDARLPGTTLPPITSRDSVQTWAKTLGIQASPANLPAIPPRGAAPALPPHVAQALSAPAPLTIRYARLEDAGVPIEEVQRLAGLCEIWVDPGQVGLEDALDLVVAGASRLVFPVTHPECSALLEELGEAAILSCRPKDLEMAQDLGIRYGCAVICPDARDVEPGPVVVFKTLAGPESWRLTLEQISGDEPPSEADEGQAPILGGPDAGRRDPGPGDDEDDDEADDVRR